LQAVDDDERNAESAVDDTLHNSARVKRPTLAELARAAGVNKSTASRALRGDPAIAPATRERIQRLARELEYEPNASARRLNSARTDLIAFSAHAPSRAVGDNDPFVIELLHAVMDEAAANGLDVFVCRPPEGSTELDTYRRIVGGHHADGFIVMDVRPDDPRLPYLCAQRFPHVLFGRSALDIDQAATYAYPWVEVDNRAGARLGTEHLIGLGHTRIAFLGCGDAFTFEVDRRRGYEDALAAAGIEREPGLFTSPGATQEDGYQLTRGLLAAERPPTAIFAVSDVLAVGAMRALRDAGVAIGRAFPVIGFDGLGLGEYVQPQLTTIKQPIRQVGHLLVRLLVAAFQEDSLPEHLLLPPELIVRSSTAGG
jgi:DNA-binding LacI/PurR family transcriptional regulator